MSISLSIGSGEEHRALQFWMDETGPSLADYGPHCDIWVTVIPQMAWQSSIVKHLLVATALLDEQLAFRDHSQSLQLNSRIFWHYQAALKMIMSGTSPRLIIVLASLIAFIFEAAAGNYSAAKVHLKATSTLVLALETPSSLSASDDATLDIVQTNIKPCLELCESFCRAMFRQKPAVDVSRWREGEPRYGHDRATSFISYKEARIAMSENIAQYFLSKSSSEAAAAEQRLRISIWHKMLCRYRYLGFGTRLHRRAINLLFNVAMAFLPESEAGAFSFSVNVATIDHILDRVHSMMQKGYEEDEAELEDRYETLRCVLDLVICYVHTDQQCARASQLLQLLPAANADEELSQQEPD